MVQCSTRHCIQKVIFNNRAVHAFSVRRLNSSYLLYRLASHLVEAVIRVAMKPVLEAHYYENNEVVKILFLIHLIPVQCDYISEKSGADVSRVFRTLQKLR